jgi:hypothetical protein
VYSIYGGAVAKVTCRTCYNTHDYKNAQVPPKRSSKKTVEKKKLIDEVLQGMAPPPVAPPAEPVPERKKRDLWADVERLKKR